MNIEILTPDEDIFKGEVDIATFPGKDGSFGVMNNHAPMIAALKAGDIVVKDTNGEQTFAVKGGVVEVLKNKVIVLAE
ncbi:MAG: ATP synthase F1 subunit epsilon [Crocinitomicaceae bacterium]|nr:ATP synthase F1 subunit epsilon [Crocinitomicaceae bacterium]|tara:strand:- start:8807 stop:9040 length:234 start_codon:yes stop_codon:yes gene_type:complete